MSEEELYELEEFIKSKMQTIARKVQGELPKGVGFVVLATPFNPNGEPTQLMYTSNCNRNDVIKMMMEWIIKTKGNYGNDTGKY